MTSSRKSSLSVLLALALTIGLLLFACSKEPPPTGGEKENASEPEVQSVVHLKPRQIEMAGITCQEVKRGDIELRLTLNGEVAFDRNRLTHITPLVAGMVRRIKKTAGDRVQAGTVLVVLSSRELASAKSEYLAARERLGLAIKNFERLKGLWKDKIAAEREYLDAQLALAEARITCQTAEQSLYTLGLSPKEVKELPRANRSLLSRYEVQAPFKGTLVEQQVTEGQQVQSDTELFVLTPLETMWVMANVYEDDIAKIKPGQSATISVEARPDREFKGHVTWIADALDPDTRTLQVRLLVPNQRRLLKANMFATVNLVAGQKKGVLTIPSSALQTESGEPFVFVEREKGAYERRAVRTGDRSDTSVEIKSGLEQGDRVVTTGAFTLTSELEKGAFGDND
jgi:membrane fusion protein, heavy metal efflux system